MVAVAAKGEVNAVADATLVSYDVVCVVPVLAFIFSPSANTEDMLSVPLSI